MPTRLSASGRLSSPFSSDGSGSGSVFALRIFWATASASSVRLMRELSEGSDFARINLTDDADAIAQKIRKARTDPEPLPGEEAGLAHRPEADNLVGIFAALKGVPKADVLADYGNAQFSTFKSALVDLAVDTMGPIGAEMKRLTADPGHIDAILSDGAARAGVIARETMAAVKDIVGFVRGT